MSNAGDRIDGISSYCDRWCERCAFTERCSSFLASAAIAMCGDADEGLELALGEPHPIDGRKTTPWIVAVDLSPSMEEIATLAQNNEEQLDRQVEETGIAKLSRACGGLARRWLDRRNHQAQGHSDPVLAEALVVASWDALFIVAKLHRALSGLHREPDDPDDSGQDPRRSDWNLSAKVALISIDRSEMAWRVIAQTTADSTPASIADQLSALRTDVERVFPAARSAIRLGFDESDASG